MGASRVRGMGKLGAVALAAAALAGCGSSPDLEILANQRPDDRCDLLQDPTGSVIRQGTFDISIGDRSSYLMTPVVRNHTSRTVEVQTVHIEVYEQTDAGPVRLRIRCDLGASCEEWDLDLCDPGPCPTVPAGDTASFEVPILPRLVTGFYQTQLDGAVMEGRVPPEFDLTSEVTLLGTSGSADVESNTFDMKVHLCLGCLVEFPPGSDSPSIPGPDCCGRGAPLPACYPGQDDPIDCRRCIMTSPEICNFGKLSCG